MAATEPIVVVKDLHKEFVLPQHKLTSLKQVFVNIGRKNPKKLQKVLDGISFEVNKGDFFGIVGRNGSGKSTLLKVLAGVYSPTAGHADVKAPLTPFIELGVGFNPELSGRDNVYLNGALLGFSHKEMDTMYDDIVDFAELREFMDQKLKNYSSGMQVRLAFSIAIKAHNEILIFDEVLAVGDEAFQRKCLDVFEHYKAEQQTVILVTHDMNTVKQFCSRALLLNKGKIVEIGDPRTVANKYSQLNQEEIDRDISKQDGGAADSVLKVDLLDARGNEKQSFLLGDNMRIKVKWDRDKLDTTHAESIGVNIFKTSGEHITGINSRTGRLQAGWQDEGAIELELELNVTKGTYNIVTEIFYGPGKLLASLDGPTFSVVYNDNMPWSGLTELTHSWRQGRL